MSNGGASQFRRLVEMRRAGLAPFASVGALWALASQNSHEMPDSNGISYGCSLVEDYGPVGGYGDGSRPDFTDIDGCDAISSDIWLDGRGDGSGEGGLEGGNGRGAGTWTDWCFGNGYGDDDGDGEGYGLSIAG